MSPEFTMRRDAGCPRANPDRPPARGTRFPLARIALSCAAFACLAAGCATPPVTRDQPVPFPPPPELPRLMFLTSYSGLKSVEEQTKFNRFVVGEQQDVRLSKPYGVALQDGKIYVCDTNATVVVFDVKNRKYGTLKGAVGAGRLQQPLNISIGADGEKYVADPGRGQVVVFDRNDEYVRAYGLEGKWRPVDAVAYRERLYVADMGNNVVRVFDRASGQAVATIGDKGQPEDRLDRPTNLAVDDDGMLYVTDASRFQVLKFDEGGTLKGVVGGPGDGFGRFARPKGIALDAQKRLYAVDASFGNVQIFNRDGRLLMYFGGGGKNAGNLTLPAKVTIDYDNVPYFRPYAPADFEIEYLVVVTSQFGERLVNVFGYGHAKGTSYPSDDELQKQLDARRKADAK